MSLAPHLLVGLGNPGDEYRRTRHNVGFLVADRLAAQHGRESWRQRFGGELCRAEVRGQDAFLLKPLSFMNLSGQVVSRAAAFFKVPLERIVIIHDDADLPWGALRLKAGGGHGGHNGLRSILTELSGDAFGRVRVGIGRSGGHGLTGHVLGTFTASERSELEDLLGQAAEATAQIVAEGIGAAMNRWNVRPKAAVTEENEDP